MKRRVKKVRLFWDELDEEGSYTASTIFESDDTDDGFTGLYDADGEPIFREKIPFGFVGKGE